MSINLSNSYINFEASSSINHCKIRLPSFLFCTKKTKDQLLSGENIIKDILEYIEQSACINNHFNQTKSFI